MQFCPKCGSILMPKKQASKTILACPRCSYKTKDIEKTEIKEKVAATKTLDIVEEEKEALPLVDRECPKCKHTKAYFWEIQTRAGDEAATQFFKCEKCKHTWRHYD